MPPLQELVRDNCRLKVAAALAIAWVQAALDAALTKKGPEARVTVLTHAPDMLPVIR